MRSIISVRTWPWSSGEYTVQALLIAMKFKQIRRCHREAAHGCDEGQHGAAPRKFQHSAKITIDPQKSDAIKVLLDK